MPEKSWEQVLTGVIRSQPIPGSERNHFGRNRTVVRAPLLNLRDELNMIRQDPRFEPSSEIELFCDLLIVPGGETIHLKDQVLSIVARSIDVQTANGGAAGKAAIKLACSAEGFSSVLAYSRDVNGDLSIQFDGEAADIGLGFEQSKGRAVTLSFNESGKPEIEDDPISIRHLSIDWFEEGSDLHFQLFTTFFLASVLWESQSERSAQLLEWIATVAGDADAFLDLLATAQALQDLEVTAGAEFVPLLSRKLYEDLSKTYGTEAEAYANAYKEFTARKENLALARQSAGILLAKARDHSKLFLDELLRQAEKNFTDSEAAIMVAQRRMKSQQTTADNAKTRFQTGIEIWEREQKLALSMKLLDSLFEFGANLAMLYAAGPEFLKNTAGLTENLQGAVGKGSEEWTEARDAYRQAKDVLTSLDLFADTDAARQTIKDFRQTYDTLKGIQALLKIAPNLQKVYKSTQLAVSAATNLANAKKASSVISKANKAGEVNETGETSEGGFKYDDFSTELAALGWKTADGTAFNKFEIRHAPYRIAEKVRQLADKDSLPPDVEIGETPFERIAEIASGAGDLVEEDGKKFRKYVYTDQEVGRQ